MPANPDVHTQNLLAALQDMSPTERSRHLAELAQVDPQLAVRLAKAMDFQDQTTSNAEREWHVAETVPADLDVDAFLNRRAQVIEQVWKGREVGAYEIESVIGQGGMGIVLAAHHRDTRAPVAIKMVRPDLVSTGLDARLKRESDALARFDHPGVARFLGMGMTADGRPFLVMERIEGLILDRAWQSLDLRAAVALLSRAADVVGHAHEQQIVHRDLKPSNILVAADGSVKLLDFGIAKCLEDQAQLTRTLTADRMLTPRYAAPEQLLGQAATPATDVYALGVMLYELAIACAPEAADADSVTAPQADTSRDTETDTTRIADAGLRAIADAALSTDLRFRYRDAGEFHGDLERWLRQQSPRVQRWPYRLRRQWASTQRFWLVLGSASLLLAALAYGYWYVEIFGQREVETGMAIQERDLFGLTRAQKQSVRAAFQSDATGDRERAMALMGSVADASDDNALPALMMARWSDARGSNGADYRARGLSLLKTRPNPYLALVFSSDEPDVGDAESERGLRAALALRPQAWRLRFALAHRAISSNQAADARRLLAEIEFDRFDDRRIPQVLADRALLGDCAQVRPIAMRMPDTRALWRDWVLAACDFSERRFEDALRRMQAVEANPEAAREPSTLRFIQGARLLTLGQAGRFPELLDEAAAEYRRTESNGSRYDSYRNALFAMAASAKAGDLAEARDWAARAFALEDFMYQLDAHISARLSKLESPLDPAQTRAKLAQEADMPAGLEFLLDAIEAYARADNISLRASLMRARREGVAETRFAAIQVRLEQYAGLKSDGEAVLLWFAPWSDWVAQWVVPAPIVDEAK